MTEKNPLLKKGRRGKKLGANEIDQYMGSQIRLRRTMLGISQKRLGDLLSLTFQQVQKYERGFSSVGGARLFQIAQVLEVPISYFFDGMPKDVQRVMPIKKLQYRVSEPNAEPLIREDAEGKFSDDQRLTKRETLELARNYYNLTPTLRRTVLGLCRTLAKETQEENIKKQTAETKKVGRRVAKKKD